MVLLTLLTIVGWWDPVRGFLWKCYGSVLYGWVVLWGWWKDGCLGRWFWLWVFSWCLGFLRWCFLW